MWVMLLAAAWAQDDAASSTGETLPLDGPSRYAVSYRYKRLWLPDAIVMDSLYYDRDDPGAQPYDRPNIDGWVMGLEFSIQPYPSTFTFYAEYWHGGLEDGYWDDIDNPPNHDDGDWIEPEGLGMFGLGANYAYEIAMTPTSRDVWLGFHFGGGLGLGFTTGKLTQWHPGVGLAPNLEPIIADPSCQPDEIAPNRRQCPPDDEWRPPPVMPIVDVTLGLRLHIAQHAHIRFDGGIHNILYLGFAGGGEW